MADFNALSTELKILVVEYLNHASVTPAEVNPVDPGYRVFRPNRDILRLSCVDRVLRRIVAPYLFQHVILRSTVESGASLELVAKSEYARYVQRLEVVGASVIPDHQPDATKPRSLENVDLPRVVERVLSSLERFTTLEEVNAWFVLKRKEDGQLFDCEVDYFDVLGPGERPVLMDSVYRALVQNPPGTVKGLKLCGLIPCSSPVWETAEWQIFLSDLTSFSLQFRGNEDFEARIAEEDFTELMKGTPRYFWNHLHNTTHLLIAAPPQEYLVFDFESFDYVPFPLGTSSLPKLESLTLDCVLMGEAVLEILLAHAETLRCVRLRSGFMGLSNFPIDMQDGQMTWADAFGALLSSPTPFSNLTVFDVRCTGGWPYSEPVTEEREVDQEQYIMRHNGCPELRYSMTDQYYHGVNIYCDFEQHIAQLSGLEQVGDQVRADRLAYERFMGIVEGNRKRLGVV